MGLLAIIIAAAGSIGALAAVIMAYLAWSTAEDVARVQVFLDLRKSYFTIFAQMDKRFHDSSWDPRAETDRTAMQTLEQYWLHAFTEWFVTTKLNKGKFSDIWREFYKKAILGGLRNKPLRITICEMLYGSRSTTFSGRHEEFAAVIERLYVSEFGNKLCEGIQVSACEPPNSAAQ
ncbi:MAG TPA: hypothetical protein VLV54_08170 [Thermoanaerobaculia bacterium]|nr:hypothetical protein [Thermoanaerobaculia bacterium]